MVGLRVIRSYILCRKEQITVPEIPWQSSGVCLGPILSLNPNKKGYCNWYTWTSSLSHLFMRLEALPMCVKGDEWGDGNIRDVYIPSVWLPINRQVMWTLHLYYLLQHFLLQIPLTLPQFLPSSWHLVSFHGLLPGLLSLFMFSSVPPTIL
jgi:hypothetical protein